MANVKKVQKQTVEESKSLNIVEETKSIAPLEKEKKVIKPKKKQKVSRSAKVKVIKQQDAVASPVCQEVAYNQYPVTVDEKIDMIIAVVSACIQTGDKEVPKSIIKKFCPDADIEDRFYFIFSSIEDQLTVSYRKEVPYYSYNKFKNVGLNGLVATGLSLGEAFSKSNK